MLGVCFNGRAFSVIMVSALTLLVSSPAVSGVNHDANASSQQGAGSGAVQINVSWSYSSDASAPSGGQSRSQSVTVHPICWYEAGMSGAEAAKWARSGVDPNSPTGSEEAETYFPGWESHANDSEGHWYYSTCSREFAPDDETFKKAMESRKSLEYVWIPAGGQPPAPLIDGTTLARAAWKAVNIPAPTIETNPKIGDKGQTLVGMDTWVWATNGTPRAVTATATAGPVTATVTAGTAGLKLSAPDSRPSCQGFGIPWHKGMPEGSSPCTIKFTRSSAHLGGTTPLTTSVVYSASFSATDGSGGSLPAITTTNTINIPVAEVQALTGKQQARVKEN